MESSKLSLLKESEYLQIFENMEEEVHVYELMYNNEGKIVDLSFKYINPASTLNSVISRENILGKNASEIYKSSNLFKNNLDIANRVISNKSSEKFEIYLPDLGKYYLISAFSIDELYVTLGMDITKQKEAEDKIKMQSDILSQVKDAVIVADDENHITYWNNGAENLFGYKLDELYDKKFVDIVNYKWLTPEDKKNASYQLETVGKWHGDNLITKKDGKEIYVKSAVNAFNDDSGKYIGTVSIIHDITESTKIKKALEDNYERLQEAQRIGKIGNWEWDIKSNIITVSDGLYWIYGIDTGQFVKYETILDMVVPEDQQIVNDSLEKALREHQPFKYDIKILHKDGNYREISCKGEVITDFAGHPLKIVCVEQDITERKEIEYALWEAKNELESTVKRRTRELNQINMLLQNELDERKVTEEKLKESQKELKSMIEELKRSNDELQQFAYITSHDLQEPLRTISSFTQLIERRYKGQMDSDSDEFIEYIVDATRRMQELIKDLLEYSRVTTMGREFELVDTQEILQKTISNLHAAIKENDAIISYDELPEVMADSRQIGQLFQNLISNAIKFRKKDEKPKIRISARKNENEYIFNVSDNGIGIEKEYFDRIFTVFQRLHTREEYQGTGIGLSISKKIVERHGGNIWVESEPDKGSTFYFVLPIKQVTGKESISS
ncbi:MAG TPA: ATP-binding protein [Methanobacterium sp.]|nr:ATP-binding protein [Methanobacterium sp.]